MSVGDFGMWICRLRKACTMDVATSPTDVEVKGNSLARTPRRLRFCRVPTNWEGSA